MNSVVVVPWRPASEQRERAWDRVQKEWAGWEIIAADDGGQPFSRAASINLAARDVTTDVFVIADADTLTDRRQVEAACELAVHSPGMVVAFDRFAYLDERGSELVIDGYQGSWEPFITWSLQDTVSSCVAVSTDTWRTVGGFPSKFRGWGYEDVAMEVACATLCGPTRRIPGTAWHLWHPPARERPQHNLGLLNELLSARDDPEEFRRRMPASW